QNYGGTGGCNDNSTPQLKVVISCNKATTGNVKNPITGVTMPFSIGVGGGVDTVLVPIAHGYCTGSEATSSRNMGLLVTANDTVSVSAQNSKQYSCDATLVYPIEALGVDYRVISHMGDQSGNSSCYRSCFLIVATENSTTIDITPTVQTAGGKAANSTFSITLNKGETYLVQANTNKLDLSGTLIQAKDCKKIAVFSGSTRSSVLYGANNSCGASYDMLYEQMMPINMWGKKFIVIPTIYQKNRQRKADMIRIVASQNSTTIRIAGRATKNLAAGQADTVFITTNTVINASKPVGVCQFGLTEDCDKVFGGSDTDPMMMWVPPIEQSLKNLSFVCENAQTINKFFLNVIVKTSSRSSFTIDGNAPTATWNLVTRDTSYSYIQQDGLTLGKHTISSPLGFSAVLYAYGDHGSYGFNAGSSIKPLSFYTVINGKSSADFEPDSMFYTVCQGATIPFDAGGSNTTGVTWKWLIYEPSGTTVKTTKGFSKVFADTGRFNVVMIAQRPTNGVCNGLTSIDDSIKIEVRVYKKPDIKLMNDTTICLGNSLSLLSTTDGDTTYTWSPSTWLSCTKCFQPVSKPLLDTTYFVTATYKGCTPSRDTIHIYVRDSFFLKVAGDTTICRGTSTDISASAIGGLSSNLTVTWDHGLGTGLLKTVSPKVSTTYRAILTDNCTRDEYGNFYADTAYVQVDVRDSLKITMPKDTLVCEGNEVNLTVSVAGGYPGASVVTWDNGLGTGLSKTITIGANDVTYKAVLSDNCTVPKDSGYVTIKVRPSIKIDTIMFVTPVCKNQLFRVDARASGGDSTGYAFKLYDITNGVNLIDSAKGNTYPFFNVKIKDDANFQMRINQKCNSQQISKKFDVKIKNGLSINNPTPVDTICTGQSYTLNINGSSADNLPIKFVLKRKNGTVYTSIDSVTHSSTGTFNITPTTSPTEYLIVGDDNCSRTDSTTFRLFTRVPMTLSNISGGEICRNGSVPFSASVTGGRVQTYKYRWIDITNNTVIDTINRSIVHSPSNSMDIRLEVTDNCSAPVSTTARIWVAPVVTDSLMTNKINGCEPLNTVFFYPKTLAQSPLNPAFNWKWYFDGTPNATTPSSGGASHADIPRTYQNAGTYTARVEMELSNGKVCFTKTQSVTAFEQAEADFSYLPRQVDIVEPEVTFTDESINAYSWRWSFGDGNTDNTQNPKHIYGDTGLYTIILIANNSNNQCNDTTYQTLRVLDIYRIFIPEAFSPNADEFNNIWQPSFTSILTLEVTIYNRWGEKIYYSNDNTGKWDGTYNGVEVDQGIYYYHIKVRDNRKKWHYYNGTITLIR
ncbi:MAG: gliding motility-associated C-terminal domain-containing protein, partial [Bacteroidetes bacterium]|nr:gliding motility-associated C-terminal domain-containing protein [Bacteroidota bacterium]